MTGNTHLLAGVATGIVTSHFIPTITGKAVFIGACAFGSLIADIDTPKSKISKMTGPLHFLFAWCGHRAFTHSLLSVLIVSLVIIPLGINSLTTGLILGHMSHLLMDSLTVQGIPLLYPRKKRYRMAKVRTGSEGEAVVVAVILLGMILYFYLIMNLGGLKK